MATRGSLNTQLREIPTEVRCLQFVQNSTATCKPHELAQYGLHPSQEMALISVFPPDIIDPVVKHGKVLDRLGQTEGNPLTCFPTENSSEGDTDNSSASCTQYTGSAMRPRTTTCFSTGFAIGAAYWLSSPVLFGEHEPWDYSLPLYWAVMSAAGLVLGFMAERYSWTGIVGLYVGQCLVAFLRPQPNPMETIPLVFGLFAMVGIAWLLSKHRDRVPWRVVAWGIGLQVSFGLLVMKTALGLRVFAVLNDLRNGP